MPTHVPTLTDYCAHGSFACYITLTLRVLHSPVLQGLVSSVQTRWRRWRVHTRDGNGVPIALKYTCAETGIPPGPEEQVHTLTSALLQVEEHNAYLQSRGRPQFQHKVTLFDWTLTPELMGVMAQFIDWEFKIGQCITPLFGDLLLSHVFCAPTTNLHVLRLHNVNLTREVALYIVLYVRSLKQLAVRAATPDGDISHFKFERLESLQLFDGVRDAKLHWLPRPLAGQYQIFIGQENVWHMTVYAHVAITALQQKVRRKVLHSCTTACMAAVSDAWRPCHAATVTMRAHLHVCMRMLNSLADRCLPCVQPCIRTPMLLTYHL